MWTSSQRSWHSLAGVTRVLMCQPQTLAQDPTKKGTDLSKGPFSVC